MSDEGEISKKGEGKSAAKMNPVQYTIFLKYWGMGNERSLAKLREMLRQESTANTPEKLPVPAIDTLKLWSGKFEWQAKIAELDEQANSRLFTDAIEAARQSRIDIMKVFRAVVLRYAKQLKENENREISSNDIATFWKMARVEMGLATDRPDLTSGGQPLAAGRTVYVVPQELKDEIMRAFKAWGVGPAALPVEARIVEEPKQHANANDTSAAA